MLRNVDLPAPLPPHSAWTVPGRRLVPHWGRTGEVIHTLIAISLIPLLLQVLGLFPYLRGLGG